MQIRVKTERYNLKGIELFVQDLATSGTLEFVAKDIENNAYGIHDISPDPKLIVDCGAHVGMVSMYLAKKHPNAQIIAVEPFSINLINFEHNLRINEITNVSIVKKGLTSDGRLIDLGCSEVNSGGVCPHWGTGTPHIPSCTLSELLAPYEKVDFLKLDIEGFEFEILPHFNDWHKIQDAGIEIHNKMGSYGGTIDEIKALKAHLKTVPITGKMWTPPLEAFIDELST